MDAAQVHCRAGCVFRCKQTVLRHTVAFGFKELPGEIMLCCDHGTWHSDEQMDKTWVF